MKNESFLVICCLAVLLLCLARGGVRAEPPRRFTCLQIAVTESVYTTTAFSNHTQIAWAWWAGSTNYANLWAGWDGGFRSIAQTNVTVWLYRNSIKNIKADLLNTTTPMVCSNLVAKIKNNPQIKVGISRTPDADLISWGIERKP
ncbi:MAG: hypothetical protein ACYTEQ_28250 [Planctomycetota bacterium]|jgi:hypothetical protein